MALLLVLYNLFLLVREKNTKALSTSWAKKKNDSLLQDNNKLLLHLSRFESWGVFRKIHHLILLTIRSYILESPMEYTQMESSLDRSVKCNARPSRLFVLTRIAYFSSFNKRIAKIKL